MHGAARNVTIDQCATSLQAQNGRLLFKKSKLSQLTCKWVEVSELNGWPGNCTGGNKSIVYGLWGGENPVKQICNFLRRHFCSYIKGDFVSGQTANRVREWQLSP